MDVRVGILSQRTIDERARDALAAAGDAGIDHVGSVDHISFRSGDGVDGLVTVAAIAGLHPTMGLFTGIYLLPLRHPAVVARQLSTVSHLAPGRLVFGVGIGGEDRREYEMLGIDPATRGRRMEEHLAVLRQLVTGEPVTFRGEFVEIEDARVLPTPPVPVPIVVGGRSDAAIRRAGRLGDGWMAVWNSVSRFQAGLAMIEEEAEASGRGSVEWVHSQTFWVGFGDDRGAARDQLAATMQKYYGVPFEGFEKYCPSGGPQEIADYIAPYVEAGAHMINLVPIAANLDAAIAGVAEVKRLLAS